MSLIYTVTYNALIDKIASHIVSIVDNIDSTKFANIEACFKSGYSFTKEVKGTQTGTSIYVKSGSGAIDDCTYNGPHIGGTGSEVKSKMNQCTVVFSISDLNNPILQQANTIKQDLILWLNTFNFPFNLNDKITTNGLELVTKLVLQFCVYKIRYVISPHSDNYYFEYTSNSIGNIDIVSVNEYECENEIIKANDTKDLLQYIENNIKNSLKYKSISYKYSHEKKLGNKIMSTYNYYEVADVIENIKYSYNGDSQAQIDALINSDEYKKLSTAEQKKALDSLNSSRSKKPGKIYTNR